MKFGKFLRSAQQQSWAEFYFDYKMMKKKFLDASKVSNDEFLVKVNEELSRVETFWREQLERLEATIAATATADDAGASFAEAAALLDQLVEFANLNTEALRKILKKRRKLTPPSSSGAPRVRFTRFLFVYDFLDSKRIRDAYTAIDLGQCQYGPPEAAHFTCGVCLKLLTNPIALSCCHRFCADCFHDDVDVSDESNDVDQEEEEEEEDLEEEEDEEEVAAEASDKSRAIAACPKCGRLCILANRIVDERLKEYIDKTFTKVDVDKKSPLKVKSVRKKKSLTSSSTSTTTTTTTTTTTPTSTPPPTTTTAIASYTPSNDTTTPTYVTIGDFERIRLLGIGNFGRVYLVRLKRSGQLYALKCVSKRLIDSDSVKFRRLMNERNVLVNVSHPFIVTLYFGFQSSTRLYMAMEYCGGGTLWALIRRQPHGVLSEAQAQFYTAETIVALEYLHLQGLFYRDLKPQNVLVHATGHVRLTDFDLVARSDDMIAGIDVVKARGLGQGQKKIFRNVVDGSTTSFCGTVEYCAPEVVRGEAYTSAVDWWTLGLLMYEMIYGFSPFRGTTIEQCFDKILHAVSGGILFNRLPSTNALPTKKCRNLIIRLVEPSPKTRLGAQHGAHDVKSHPFFANLRFSLLLNETPPLIPDLNRVQRDEEATAAAAEQAVVSDEAGDDLRLDFAADEATTTTKGANGNGAGDDTDDAEVERLLRQLRLLRHWPALRSDGFDTIASLTTLNVKELVRDFDLKPGHARLLLKKAKQLESKAESTTTTTTTTAAAATTTKTADSTTKSSPTTKRRNSIQKFDFIK